MSITRMRSGRKQRLHGQRGLTLVELVLFIIIVGIAVAGILVGMSYASKRSGDPQLRKQALIIAESLLEQVESARYTYCDPTDIQAPFATAAVPGAMGPQPPGSSAAAGGCSSMSMVESTTQLSTTDPYPYNNVHDYVTTLGTQQQISIMDVGGTAPAYGTTGNYTAYLTISKAALPGMVTDPGASALGSALLITVIVTYSGGNVQLDGYRTQYAPQLMP